MKIVDFTGLIGYFPIRLISNAVMNRERPLVLRFSPACQSHIARRNFPAKNGQLSLSVFGMLFVQLKLQLGACIDQSLALVIAGVLGEVLL